MLIGFICGFIGAGRYDDAPHPHIGVAMNWTQSERAYLSWHLQPLRAASHFIGGKPDWFVLLLCIAFTLLWARIAAVFANKASAKTLNRATGIVLVILGIVVFAFHF